MATQAVRKIISEKEINAIKDKIGYRVRCCKNCIRKEYQGFMCRMHKIEVSSWGGCNDWMSYYEGMRGDVPIPGIKPEIKDS